jgi:acetyl esterase
MGLRAAMDTFAPMMNSNLPEIGALHEAVEIRPGLKADVAVPKGNGPHPLVVYLHGGGWIGGSPKTHRKLGMQFAEAGYLTINVDYRLAPEHPFPAALEDCMHAVKWTGDNAKRWNGDASRLAVGGDSAGGNLTAATLTSLAAEKYAGAKPKAALLIYGVFDFPATLKRDSNVAFDGMVKAYAGAGYPAILEDPRVSPLRAVKPGAMPPSFIICGTADPLLPETHSMADALKRADIRHEVVVLDDMPHGFLQMDLLSGCRQGLDKMFDFLRRTI